MQGKAILVLGMHRSGTSALGGVLSECGVDMGSHLLPATADNERGFFEDMEVVRLNESLLQCGGMQGSWDSVFMPDHDWLQLKGVADLLEAATDVIRREYDGNALIGMKDPRICQLLPFWKTALTAAGYTAAAVCIYRNPIEVASSLAQRNRIDRDVGVLLWARHVLELEKASRDVERCFVAYEQLLDDPKSVVSIVQTGLGVNFPRGYRDSEKTITSFLAPQLRHHRNESADLEGFPSAARNLHQLMRDVSLGRASDSQGFRREMDAIYCEQEFWLRPAASQWRHREEALTTELQRLSERLDHLSQNLDAIIRSRTYKIGRLVTKPFRVARRLARRLRLRLSAT